ncbi:MAG: hypothetical protein COA43_08105 [Robiginitomaculum sp.]|nr:MAG: hypothetical protein COA43_08105 [Robiginitomaculum sp.]
MNAFITTHGKLHRHGIVRTIWRGVQEAAGLKCAILAGVLVGLAACEPMYQLPAYTNKKCGLASASVFFEIEDMMIKNRYIGNMHWNKNINVYLSEHLNVSINDDEFFKQLARQYYKKMRFKTIAHNTDDNKFKAVAHDTEYNKSGIFVYAYSMQEHNEKIDFNVRKLNRSTYGHSWELSTYSDYYITRSFVHRSGVKEGFELYTPLSELFVGSAHVGVKAPRNLRSVMLEYYRKQTSGGEFPIAVIDRVNCFINVDDKQKIDFLLRECLIRSMGFPSSYLNLETEFNLEVPGGFLRHYFSGQKYPDMAAGNRAYLEDLECVREQYSGS